MLVHSLDGPGSDLSGVGPEPARFYRYREIGAKPSQAIDHDPPIVIGHRCLRPTTGLVAASCPADRALRLRRCRLLSVRPSVPPTPPLLILLFGLPLLSLYFICFLFRFIMRMSLTFHASSTVSYETALQWCVLS